MNNPDNNPERKRRELSAEEVVAENMKKRKVRRENRKKTPGFFIKPLIVIGAVLGLIIFSLSGFFTIRNIEVNGNRYYTDNEIIQMAHAETGGNLLYRPEKKKIRTYLERDPYINSVEIHRKLPGTLIITVKERSQIAAIKYGDEYLVIDRNGTLLRKTETQPKVTMLTGIKIKKATLGEPLEARNEDVFKDALTLLGKMEDGGIYFIRIEMSEMYIKAYVYESMVVSASIKEIESAIDQGHIQQILQKLFAKNIKRGTIAISEDGYASFTPDI